MATLPYILLFLVMISLLVAAHEFGHFLVAKLCGMQVEEFAIGFGKPYWTYARKNGTDYTLRPLPLGGFVRTAGMLPEEDGSEVNVVNGFYSKPPFHRFLMLLAGPVFSILAGLAILIPLNSMYGVRDRQPVIGIVAPDMPAKKAGLVAGDRILSIDGVPIRSMSDVIFNIRDKAGKNVTIVYQHGAESKTVSLVPALDKEPTPYMVSIVRPITEKRRQGKIGIGPSDDLAIIKVPVGEATVAALRWPVDMVENLVSTFIHPSTFKDNVGGPATIAKESIAAAKSGWDAFVQLAALLSISLGIFNLLPFVPLDGGQMVMALVEMVRGGKRLSIKVQGVFQSIGVILVGMLFLGVIFADVSRYMSPKETKPVQTPAK